MNSRADDLLADLSFRLIPLIHRSVKDHADALISGTLGESKYAQSLGSVPPEAVELASQVRALVPNVFRDDADVINVVLHWLVERDQESKGIELELDAADLAQRLRNPEQSMGFAIPISLVSDVSISGEIGGPSELRIDSASISPERYCIDLSGTTRATTVNRALEIAERHVRSFLGLSIASGLAMLRPSRRVEDVRAKIETRTGSVEQAVDTRVATLCGAIFGVGKPAVVIAMRSGERRDEAVHRAQATLARIFQVVADAEPSGLYGSSLLFADALACPDNGQSLALAFMSLEALLLEDSKRDLLARIAEAVAFRIGTDRDSRRQLRRRIGKLYDARSSYVHTGAFDASHQSRTDLLRLVADAIGKELDELAVGDTSQ